MMIHSNENVTEKRGGTQALLASRAWVPPRFSAIFRPAVSFLLLKPLPWRMPCFGSTTVLSVGRSLHASSGDSSAHRAFASAALAGRLPLARGFEPLKRRTRLIPLATHLVSHDRLFAEVHRRLEQIVVDPHLLVERIHRLDLLGTIKAQVAKILAHQGVILLFDEAIIVFLVGATA